MNFWSKGTLYGNSTVHLHLTFFQWSVEWYIATTNTLHGSKHFFHGSILCFGGKSRDPKYFLVLKQRPSPLLLISNDGCVRNSYREDERGVVDMSEYNHPYNQKRSLPWDRFLQGPSRGNAYWPSLSLVVSFPLLSGK